MKLVKQELSSITHYVACATTIPLFKTARILNNYPDANRSANNVFVNPSHSHSSRPLTLTLSYFECAKNTLRIRPFRCVRDHHLYTLLRKIFMGLQILTIKSTSNQPLSTFFKMCKCIIIIRKIKKKAKNKYFWRYQSVNQL